MKWEKGDQIRVRGKHFIGVQIHPGARRGIARRHGEFLDGRDGGLKGSSIVSGKGADIVGPKDRHKKMEFAAINKFVKKSRKQKRVDGSTGGGDGDGQRSGIQKDRVEGDLSVKEVKRPEVGGGRSAFRISNGSHAGREYRGGRGSSSGSENKVLELVRGEQGETLVIVIR